MSTHVFQGAFPFSFSLFPHGHGKFEEQFADLLFYWCVVILFLVWRNVAKKNAVSNGRIFDHKKELLSFFLVLIAVVSLIQTTQHLKDFWDIRKAFKGRGAVEKRLILFGKSYGFSLGCKRQVQGKCIARLITDLDLSRKPGMSEHRFLRYYLYPISIEAHPPEDEPDCLVFYQKKDALNNIPPGYTVKYQLDEQSLLAVKDKKENAGL